MKKWMIVLSSAAVVLGAGGYVAYQAGMNLAADKISEELEKNPEVMKQIEEEIKKNEKELAQLAEEANLQGKEAEAQENGDTVKSSSSANDNGSTSGEKNDSAVSKTSEQSASQAPAETSEQSASQASSTEQPNSSGGKEFSSRNEAVRFAMSRFSAGEMNEMRKMASDGLTAEEKAILKQKAFSNFTPEEMAAVQRALSN